MRAPDLDRNLSWTSRDEVSYQMMQRDKKKHLLKEVCSMKAEIFAVLCTDVFQQPGIVPGV